MLTVAKVTGTHAGGYADYLQGKTTPVPRGDYYLKDGERVEAPGRWIAGASAVGVDGAARVTGGQLGTLMDVRRPDSGEPLRPPGAGGEAVSALDATFSAPKSVSAAWALADPVLRTRLEAAHETAVDATIAYATAQVAMVRERIDRRTVIHTRARELIATGWRHTTARAVDGPPDPQLHTHVLLHAAVRRDGQTVAIDSRTWLTHRRELGAAYRSELARELNALGFQVTRGTGRGQRYFELDGIPQELLDRWSSRHHQVRQAIEDRLQARRAELQEIIDSGQSGATDALRRLRDLDATGLRAAEDRFLARVTRADKLPETRGDLDTAWRETTTEITGCPLDLDAIRDPQRPVLTPDRGGLETQLTEHEATLTRTQARAIALEQNAGVPIRDALVLLAEMRDHNRLLTLADGSLTTASHRSREHATAALAARLADATVDPIPVRLVEQSAARLDQQLQQHGGTLLSEQRAALTLTCGDSQLTVIEGQAGTGKSTVMAGVANAHEAAGQTMIVTSTSALAAQRLTDELDAAGAHASSYSTVALDRAITQGRVELDPTTTIVHDEAALASTRELHALLDHAETTGARIILIGDPRQSAAVGAGGLWPYFQTSARAGDAYVVLADNLRARDPADALAQRHFRDGEAEAALDSYDQRGRLHLSAEQRTVEDEALDRAWADEQAGRRTVVISQTTNDHLDELNARAQAIRHQDGHLGTETLPLAGRPYPLRAGDHIQLRASISHPEHGMLRNGTTADVTAINAHAGTASLALSGGGDVQLAREQLNAAQTRLAYVQHPFPAQGITTDTSHVIVGEHPTREGTYVALTRARETTDLYAATATLNAGGPPRPQIAERLSATEPELPSISQPLAHERAISENVERAARTQTRNSPRSQREATSAQQLQRDAGPRDEPSPDAQRSLTRTDDPIRSYRTRYAIPDDDLRPLGPPPAADAFQQRLDRRAAAREALERLPRNAATTNAAFEQLTEAARATGPVPARAPEPDVQF